MAWIGTNSYLSHNSSFSEIKFRSDVLLNELRLFNTLKYCPGCSIKIQVTSKLPYIIKTSENLLHEGIKDIKTNADMERQKDKK
jgi:hypothetical protein